MKGLFSNRVKVTGIVVAALSLVVLAGLAVDTAEASNMGFKNHRVIEPVDGPFPNGENLVALPFRNPYVDADDICAALGLTPGTGQVLQLNAQTGSVLTNAPGCGVGNFALLPRIGIIVRNNVQTSGMIVGSHQGNPPGTITVQPLGAAFPLGQNDFPVPFHTTSVNSEDVCVDLGIPAGLGSVRRFDAATGGASFHPCGGGAPFALHLGESVRIEQTTGSPINVPPGRPAHF